MARGKIYLASENYVKQQDAVCAAETIKTNVSRKQLFKELVWDKLPRLAKPISRLLVGKNPTAW
jgi:hypothetical protein